MARRIFIDPLTQIRSVPMWSEYYRRPCPERGDNHTAFRCVQQPGDLIYVPDSWGHGVLNLGATAGWAKSFYVQQHTFIHPPHHFVQDGKLLRVL